MAEPRDTSFFEKVCQFALSDKREITATVMNRVERRGVPIIFSHDAHGVPVVIELEGSHSEIKRSLRLNEDGTFTAQKSVGSSSYVGPQAAIYLSSLGLITGEQYQIIKTEALNHA